MALGCTFECDKEVARNHVETNYRIIGNTDWIRNKNSLNYLLSWFLYFFVNNSLPSFPFSDKLEKSKWPKNDINS